MITDSEGRVKRSACSALVVLSKVQIC